MNRWTWLVALVALAACTAPEVTERYRAEQAFFGVDRQLVMLRRAGEPIPTELYRGFAAEYEAVARAIPQREDPGLREIEGRAWLRAAECRFAIVDSTRAELILATAARRFADIDFVTGEVSLALGRVNEHHGEYRTAIHYYEDVVGRVAPDPGPDPKNPPSPDAPPEEETADDFVLRLPLHMARLAARDTTVVDPERFYEDARSYYETRLEDPSPFVRIESTLLLGEVLADRGAWDEASRTVDAIEGRIPGIVLSRHENADARLASVGYQVQALCFGTADADSVRGLVERLIRDYPHGDYAPAALFAMANCAQQRGRTREAHQDLARLVRDYPTAPVVAEAQLLRARIYARAGDWRNALRTLRSLPLEFPTSDAALRAPLEVAAYYRNQGDAAGERDALARAERRYLEVLERYPEGEHSFETREKLVTVYDLQGRQSNALDEVLAMCDEVASPAQRPALLFDAARRAELQLREPARAAVLYQRLADEFPDTRLGRAALREVHRILNAQEK